jgi:hypothetical protein
MGRAVASGVTPAFLKAAGPAPSSQQPLKQLEKEIKGHEKEIRQKWPGGAPTE